MIVAPATCDARTDLDRDRLAGQHRHVDGRAAVLDLAVGRDLLARARDERHPSRRSSIGMRRSRTIGVEHRDVLRPHLEQRLDRGPGAALRARLEEPAEEDEGGHDRGDLEVDLVPRVAQEQHVHRPEPGGERAEADERVHRRGSVTQVHPRRAVEGPSAPEHDRRGEEESNPLPGLELERHDHRHREHRRGQQRTYDHPRAQLPRFVSRQRRLVAGGRDRRGQVARINRAGVVVHRRPLGGEVHRRLHAVELVQRPFDARGARRAGHAADRQFEMFRGHGLSIPP